MVLLAVGCWFWLVHLMQKGQSHEPLWILQCHVEHDPWKKVAGKLGHAAGLREETETRREGINMVKSSCAWIFEAGATSMGAQIQANAEGYVKKKKLKKKI